MIDKKQSQSQQLSPAQKQLILFNSTCYIYKMSLTPSGIIPLTPSVQTKNRMIRQFQNYQDFFCKVQIKDDGQDSIKNKKYLNKQFIRPTIDKITMLNKQFLPLGWSGSQLRSFSLWYVSQIPVSNEQYDTFKRQIVLKFLGNFENIKIPAKKSARIGQCFSSSIFYDFSNVTQLPAKDDPKSPSQFIYTDGIGKISSNLLQQIKEQLQQKYNVDDLCCIQIRYKGAKGILTSNYLLPKNSIQLRNSMIKYQCQHPNAKKYLDIVGWNKHISGYLNRQTIILLKSLQIDDKFFIALQDEYINNINKLTFSNPNNILYKIFKSQQDQKQNKQNFFLTIKSISSSKSFIIQQEPFFQKLLKNIQFMKIQELNQKCRIYVEKSARLIGIIDQYSILQEGELFCTIKVQQQYTNIQGKVLITRNPALSPADIRPCICISQQQIKKRLQKKYNNNSYFDKFVNCIVFPQKGYYPLTSQISGSDLDGDTFFICWQISLLPQNKNYYKPQILDAEKEKPKQLNESPGYPQMLDFFMEYVNSQTLGVISNAHLIFAQLNEDGKYAGSPICKELAKLQGQAVDYAKTGLKPKIQPRHYPKQYPHFMKKWSKTSYFSQQILGILFDKSQQSLKKIDTSTFKISNNILKQQIIKNLKQQSDLQKTIVSIYQQLIKFEEQTQRLIQYTKSKNQFQLYSGLSIQQNKGNQYGKERLVNLLFQFKKRHILMFFNQSDEMYQNKQEKCLTKKYLGLKLKSVTKSVHYFNSNFIMKAQLFYLISYICNFQDDNQAFDNIEKIMMKYRKIYQKILKNRPKQYRGKFIGFVWYIIPKIMIQVLDINK